MGTVFFSDNNVLQKAIILRAKYSQLSLNINAAIAGRWISKKTCIMRVRLTVKTSYSVNQTSVNAERNGIVLKKILKSGATISQHSAL